MGIVRSSAYPSHGGHAHGPGDDPPRFSGDTILMINRNLVRGIFLMGLALVFGLPAIGYSLGTFSRAGPGMFPFMVSVILFAIGVISVPQ